MHKITRKQVSKNSPAIAQLLVQFSHQIDDFKLFCDYIDEHKFEGVDYTVDQKDDMFIIEVRSQKYMYSLLKRFEIEIQKKYGRAVVQGEWDNFGKNQIRLN